MKLAYLAGILLALVNCDSLRADEPISAHTDPADSAASAFGDCSGNIDTRWLEDGRKMKLLADYTYVDPTRKKWLAPRDSVIDGASIPQPAWPFIGGPFEGLYRKASVVHDVACDVQRDDWRDVHQMFYEASRCGGVALVRAKIMYWAVYHCGPRWGTNQGRRLVPCSNDTLPDDIRRMKVLVRNQPDIAIESIQAISERHLADVVVDLRAFDNAVAKLKSISPTVRAARGVRILLSKYAYDPGRKHLSLNEEAIEEVAALFRDIPGVDISVEAKTTSSSGSAAFARSEKEVAAVAKALVERGISYQNISTRADVIAAMEPRPDGRRPSPLTYIEMWIREGL